MLLEKIKIFNFRQFKDEIEIDFKISKERNVIVINGQNGSGKTSLAQAFRWVLYGETDFSDKNVLNRKIASEKSIGEIFKVIVSLTLTHKNVRYSVVRKQTYRKESQKLVKGLPSELCVSYPVNGSEKFLSSNDSLIKIRQILPKELASYFFFDGEKIDKLSKEIHKGKSNEFRNAVRGLLGLNALLVSVEHLKPNVKGSVIGYYNSKYDYSSDGELENLLVKIDELNEKGLDLSNRLETLEYEIEMLDEKIKELENKIKDNVDGKKLQEKKEQLIINNKDLREGISQEIYNISSVFGINYFNYFGLPLIEKALNIISKNDVNDLGIPYIHAETIKYLLNRKECICGSKFETGDKIFLHLNELFKYIPPQSIGTQINAFKKESEIRIKNHMNLFQNVEEYLLRIRESNAQIDRNDENVLEISNVLKNADETASIERSLLTYEKDLSEKRSERDLIISETGINRKEIERAENLKSELARKSEKNLKIETYRAYAYYIYEVLKELYSTKEVETLAKLESYINVIFKQIYRGGLSIEIDKNYNIEVKTDDVSTFNQGIETSTAQSISVIFSFIAGVIKMARESAKSNDSELIEAEAYPLVMDAPLSAFDTERIKTVCDTLPRIAEQVVLFIKDTDGKIATEYLADKINKTYSIRKKSELESVIEIL